MISDHYLQICSFQQELSSQDELFPDSIWNTTLNCETNHFPPRSTRILKPVAALSVKLPADRPTPTSLN